MRQVKAPRRVKRKRPPIRRSKNRLIFFLLIVFAVGFWQGISARLSSPGERPPLTASAKSEAQTTKKPDAWDHWQLMFNIRDEIRKVKVNHYVTIDEVPLTLKQAMIAVEDGRFYSHHGFDWEGMLRAAFVNVQSGEIEEGASTITQQLVKNLFLSPEQTFSRKAEEIALAVIMENNFSKDEILELYLNTIYFGSNFYGIAEASEGYFAKEPTELNLAEATMLAGLPNAPSLYSPYVDFMLAKKRQIIVLDAMERRGYITKKMAEDAKIQPINLARKRD